MQLIAMHVTYIIEPCSVVEPDGVYHERVGALIPTDGVAPPGIVLFVRIGMLAIEENRSPEGAVFIKDVNNAGGLDEFELGRPSVDTRGRLRITQVDHRVR